MKDDEPFWYYRRLLFRPLGSRFWDRTGLTGEVREVRCTPMVTMYTPYYHASFSNACNLRCFYCFERPHVSVPKVEPAPAILERLMAARDAGYDRVFFASGELLLHPAWAALVRGARDRGFSSVGLVTNLTTLTSSALDDLWGAGLTELSGTVYAWGDEDGAIVTGVARTVERRNRAIAALRDRPDVMFIPHFVITKGYEARLLETVRELFERLGRVPPFIVFSIVEPIRPAVAEHPAWTDGTAVDWEALCGALTVDGAEVLTQNVPACVLGSKASVAWTLRRRIARAISGWPRDPDLAKFVNASESIFRNPGRTIPDDCQPCPLLSVCENVYDHPNRPPPAFRAAVDLTAGSVIERALIEMGAQGDEAMVSRLEDVMRWILTQSSPASSSPI